LKAQFEPSSRNDDEKRILCDTPRRRNAEIGQNALSRRAAYIMRRDFNLNNSSELDIIPEVDPLR